MNEMTDDRLLLRRRMTGELLAAPYGEAWRHVFRPLERALLEATSHAYGGNQVQMARCLGINRNTLRRRLLEHGLMGPPAALVPMTEVRL